MFADFAKLAKIDDSNKAKADVIKQICMELTIHAQAEEEIFYPAVHAAIGDEDLMVEADVEHAGAKNLIAQLDREFSISVSIGLCALTEVDGDFSHVLCHADNACYEAKKKGRNRIHAFTYSSPKCVELSSLNG